MNATPVGGAGQERAHPSLPPLGPGVLVIDLLYDPASTDLQRRAREAGAAVFGGLGHLLEQAALAFELWTGTPAPLEVMSAAAARRTGGAIAAPDSSVTPATVDAPCKGMNDYSALAQRVSMSIDGIRGCLLLSRDGMVLGAHPEGDAESHLRSAWVRFAAVGDPERSYVEFPDQVWAFVRRGGYSAFAVADTGVRPGVLVDLLEQALMTGEQGRAHDRETMRLPEVPPAPSGKPRTSLHKQERAPDLMRLLLRPSRSPPPQKDRRPPIAASRPRDRSAVPSRLLMRRATPAQSDAGPPPEDPSPRRAGEGGRAGGGPDPPRERVRGPLQVPKEDDEASR